ncbi:MAG TPA: hypothetical protein VE130_01850 [Nitrososphaeraceae archaeon]|jgi:hypothetical protein|nr:hypothetical protein [Nitrososphaeraceae archaeon]
MEKEFEKRVKFLEERSSFIEMSDESHLEVEMDEEDIKKTLHEVLNELYYSKKSKTEI